MYFYVCSLKNHIFPRSFMAWLCLNRTTIIRIPNFHSFWQQNNNGQTIQKQISNIKCHSSEQLPFCLISSRSLLHSKAIRGFLIGNWKITVGFLKDFLIQTPASSSCRSWDTSRLGGTCCARSRNCNLWFTPGSTRRTKKKRPQAGGAAGFCPRQLNETNYFDIRKRWFWYPKHFNRCIFNLAGIIHVHPT